MSPHIVYTDGSCKPNPGTGGYAVVILKDGKTQEEFAEAYEDTTNNQMELCAVIKALELLPEKSSATIISDSKYVINTITKGWKRNANKELWETFDKLYKDKQQTISWWWVKGHAGNKFNEHADQLAQKAADKLKEKLNG